MPPVCPTRPRRSYSAGGHLATLLSGAGDLPEMEGHSGSPGYSSQVRAVTAVSTPTDVSGRGGLMINDAAPPITRLFGGTVHERAALMRLASPLYHVAPGGPPIPPMLTPYRGGVHTLVTEAGLCLSSRSAAATTCPSGAACPARHAAANRSSPRT